MNFKKLMHKDINKFVSHNQLAKSCSLKPDAAWKVLLERFHDLEKSYFIYKAEASPVQLIQGIFQVTGHSGI